MGGLCGLIRDKVKQQAVVDGLVVAVEPEAGYLGREEMRNYARFASKSEVRWFC